MLNLGARKGLDLKWLEIFQLCARNRSLRETANETGLSISTVSHHLRCLEDHLGVALFNHARRQMFLTPKGHVFLLDIDIALRMIRKAKAEASAGALTEASYLRLGPLKTLKADVYVHNQYCSAAYRKWSFKQPTDTVRLCFHVTMYRPSVQTDSGASLAVLDKGKLCDEHEHKCAGQYERNRVA